MELADAVSDPAAHAMGGSLLAVPGAGEGRPLDDGSRDAGVRDLLLQGPPARLSLKVCQIVRPMTEGHWSHRFWTVILHPKEFGLPSKTNQWGDSKALDLEDHTFFASVMQALVRGRGEADRVFDFTYPEWRQAYKTVGEKLRLQVLGPPTLCCLRHPGASLDAACHRRSMEAMQQRGNWAQATSMRRYQKGGRLMEQLLQLSRSQRRAACDAAASIGAIMSQPAGFSLSAFSGRGSRLSASLAAGVSPRSGGIGSTGRSSKSTTAGATASTSPQAIFSAKCEDGPRRA